MFSEKAYKNADACRFCWMCRHLCPVQLVTGKETNTPRAKGLMVSMMKRGMPMEADAAQTMYECLLCGACTNDCATGFDPLVFIREGRTEALVNGITLPCVEGVIERINSTGNIYGKNECGVRLDDLPEQGDTLLWLGATARYSVPQVAQAVLSLLAKAGVKAAVLHDEPASGAALGDLMGFVEDVRAQAQAAGEAIRRSGAKTLIVLDSYDAALMSHEYKEWGIELPKVVTATAFISELIAQGSLRPRKDEGQATYHDGSRLARDLDEHQPARDIIAAMGFTLHEMFLNRRMAKCCGSSVVGQYMPALREAVAKKRWEDAARTPADTLIAACPQSTEALSSTVPEGMKYQDLFVLLDERC